MIVGYSRMLDDALEDRVTAEDQNVGGGAMFAAGAGVGVRYRFVELSSLSRHPASMRE